MEKQMAHTKQSAARAIKRDFGQCIARGNHLSAQNDEPEPGDLSEGMCPVKPPRKDITGLRSGALVVVRYLGGDARGKGSWLCRCDCGAEVVRITSRFSRKRVEHRSKSCGCLTVSPARVDGMGHSPEKLAWRAMQRRCYSPDTRGFHAYGGRGIAVCDRWRNSFMDFLRDMGPRPSPLHSLDRIDNDGNYEPGNCRWATKLEQSENTRQARIIEFNGKAKCLSAWAREIALSVSALRARLANGWRLEQALTTPSRGAGTKRGINNRGHLEASYAEIDRQYGIRKDADPFRRGEADKCQSQELARMPNGGFIHG